MRLKELRKRRRITQQRLAIDLNMSQNTVSRYENGNREAGYAELIKTADYFGVLINYLIERTEQPLSGFLYRRIQCLFTYSGCFCYISGRHSPPFSYKLIYIRIIKRRIRNKCGVYI